MRKVNKEQLKQKESEAPNGERRNKILKFYQHKRPETF